MYITYWSQIEDFSHYLQTLGGSQEMQKGGKPQNYLLEKRKLTFHQKLGETNQV